jgi:integrase
LQHFGTLLPTLLPTDNDTKEAPPIALEQAGGASKEYRYSYTDRLYVNFDERFYKEFHETLSRCEIADRTPYACRHTTATALALGNIAPAVIQEIMRHTKFSTTERYIHKQYDDTAMRDALNTLSESDKAKGNQADVGSK